MCGVTVPDFKGAKLVLFIHIYPLKGPLRGGKQEKITFLIKNLSKYLVVSQKVTTFATAIQK